MVAGAYDDEEEVSEGEVQESAKSRAGGADDDGEANRGGVWTSQETGKDARPSVRAWINTAFKPLLCFLPLCV